MQRKKRNSVEIMLHYYTSILINLLIHQYYQDSRCLLIIADKTLNYNGSLPSVKIKMINKTSLDFQLVFNYYGCQGIIICLEDPIKVFVEFEAQIRFGMERFNSRRFLIVPRHDSKNFKKDFFKLRELNFVRDLLVVLPKYQNDTQTPKTILGLMEDDIVFEMETHTYCGTSNNNQAIFLDKWFSKNRSFLFGKNLYPDKFTNQLGRPLKMATFPYEPYSVIGESVEEYHGSEMKTAVEFALKHNMTPIPVVNEEDYWGEIYPNWSGNGLLGNIAIDKADIGFGALYTWEYCYHFLDLSKPLVRTGITCLVPAPKLAARWLTPFLSYSPILWLCVIIIFTVGVLILSIIFFCYNTTKIMKIKYRKIRPTSNYLIFFQRAFKIIMKPVLQQPLAKSEVPVEISSKLMMALMLVLSLFLTSTYSSGLATIMTLPRYEKVINTVEDFANSGLDWGATQDAWITSIQNATEPNYVKIVSKFHPISEEELREHSKSGKWSFSIERLPFDNFAIGSYIKEDVISNFHLMQQDLYWEQCVIMLRKNSVLLPALDLFILRIFQTGLISRWQNKAVNLYMDVNVQRVVRFYYNHHLQQEHEVVKLQFSHVEGAFAVLVIGCCASLIVFIMEIITHLKK